MSGGATRLQRLVRLNEFKEGLATLALVQANQRCELAREAHARAATAIDQLGKWKGGARHRNGALDLDAYEVALDLESVAMTNAAELEQVLEQSGRYLGLARDHLTNAKSAVRVSGHREGREQALAESAEEKRTFDRTSDVWLSNRGGRRD